MRFATPIRVESGRRLVAASIAGGLLLAFLALFAIAPARLPLPECAFHSITGHSCLTCGLTRSLDAMAHGEWSVSVRYHLFGPAVFIAMILGFVLFSTETIFGTRIVLPVSRIARNRAIAVVILSWFLYWVLRLSSEFSG